MRPDGTDLAVAVERILIGRKPMHWSAMETQR